MTADLDAERHNTHYGAFCNLGLQHSASATIVRLDQQLPKAPPNRCTLHGIPYTNPLEFPGTIVEYEEFSGIQNSPFTLHRRTPSLRVPVS